MIIRTALAAAVLMTAGLAHAEAPKIQTVKVQGRNLSTPEGARAFYRDLARAAAHVCGGQPTTGGLDAVAAFDACYAATIRQAVDKANAPLVSALANPGKPVLRIAGR
jgi:UrcA family protein